MPRRLFRRRAALRAGQATTCRHRNAPADREPVRRSDRDANSGEAAGTDTDEDLGRLRPPRSSAIIGTSRSAWPRPIPSSRESTRALVGE